MKHVFFHSCCPCRPFCKCIKQVYLSFWSMFGANICSPQVMCGSADTAGRVTSYMSFIISLQSAVCLNALRTWEALAWFHLLHVRGKEQMNCGMQDLRRVIWSSSCEIWLRRVFYRAWLMPCTFFMKLVEFQKNICISCVLLNPILTMDQDSEMGLWHSGDFPREFLCYIMS